MILQVTGTELRMALTKCMQRVMRIGERVNHLQEWGYELSMRNRRGIVKRSLIVESVIVGVNECQYE